MSTHNIYFHGEIRKMSTFFFFFGREKQASSGTTYINTAPFHQGNA